MELPIINLSRHKRVSSLRSSTTDDDLTTFSGTRKTVKPIPIEMSLKKNLSRIFVLKTLSNNTSKFVGMESMVGLLKSRSSNPAYFIYKMNAKIRCMTVTGDGRYLICGNSSGYLYVKDLEMGVEMDKQISDKAILCILHNRMHNKLYISTKDNSILIWSLNSFELENTIHNEDATYALCLDFSEKYLFTAGSNEVVYIWNLEKLEISAELEGHEESIRSLAITQDNHILASAGEDHTIRLWNPWDRSEIAVLKGHDDFVQCLLFSSDDVLVSGSSDKTIRFWSLSQKSLISVIIGHEDEVNSMCISSDNRYLISASSDKTIRLWNMKDKSLVTVLHTFNDKLNSVVISPDCNSIYSGGHEQVIYKSELDINLKIKSISDLGNKVQSLYYDYLSSLIIAGNYDNTISSLNSSSSTTSTYIIHESRVSCITISPDSSFIIASSTDASLSILNTRTSQVETKLIGHEGYIFCLCVSNDSKYVISGSMDSSIIIWSLASKQQEDTLLGHEYWVTSLYLRKDNKYLISGSGDKTIKVWDFKYRVEVFTLYGHTDRVNSVKMTHDMKSIISASEDKSIKIWMLKERQMRDEFIGHTKGVQCLCVSDNDKYLFSGGTDCTIRIWGIFDKKELAIINQPYSILNIYLIDNNSHLLILQNKKVYKLENPLHATSSLWIYPTKYSTIYMTYVSMILNKTTIKFDEEWVKYMIFPWKLNLLHIFSFLTNDAYLKKALQKGSVFIPISSGENPLTISINRRSKQCEEAIIKRMKKYIYPSNPLCYRYIEELLPALNKASLPSLHKFYEQVFCISEQNSLPAFGCLKQTPPVVHLSDSSLIDPNEFLVLENLEDKHKEEVVVFKKSLLCMNLVSGSTYSLQFFRTLMECENAEVFRTKFIHAVLAYKWKKVIRFIQIQAFLYFILLGFLTVHIFFREEILYIIMISILNLLFSLYNLVQFYVLRSKFLISLWSMLDLFRNIIIWCYMKQILIDEDYERHELLSVIILIAWLRGVGYFRIFDRTRYLINMILEVIKDMVPFLVIMIVSTFSFGLVFYISNLQDKSKAFISAYQVNFSAFDVNLEDSFQVVVFLLSCILNPLIMMNLLIAIMGDTYDRVRDGLQVADHKEMAECIFEIECLLFWRRNKTDWKYIHQVTNEENSDSTENEWSGKIRAITNSVNSLDNKSKQTRKLVEHIEEMLNKINQNNYDKKLQKKAEAFSTKEYLDKLFKEGIEKIRTEFKDEIGHVRKSVLDLECSLVKMNDSLNEIKSHILNS